MKEIFYFQHDYNARNNPKLQNVLMEHGCAGIGVFWCIVEQLHEQDGILPSFDHLKPGNHGKKKFRLL